MRILHLSDTHSRHECLTRLPEADVVVHSGDFTMNGCEEEAYDFMNWFCDLPYRHKIFIAGNHDVCMYGADLIEGLPENVHYLCNSAAWIEDVQFYGIPMFVSDCLDGSYERSFGNIPFMCDVLITHQPPYGICDLADYGGGMAHRGSVEMRACIGRLRLKAHLFGHEHEAYGSERINRTLFSNASVMDKEGNRVNEPRIVDIVF